MDVQQILRWITIAIVCLVALLLLSIVLKMAGFVMPLLVKSVVILLVAAVAVRFYSILRDKRAR